MGVLEPAPITVGGVQNLLKGCDSVREVRVVLNEQRIDAPAPKKQSQELIVVS